MRIIPRAEWGARPPTHVTRITVPTPELWIHHTADENHGPAGVRAVQNYHMDSKGWSDIAYSFLVDDDGKVYEGRGFGVAGGHTKGHNTISHAICFLGNFQNRKPTDAALKAAQWLFWEGKRKGQWVKVTGGHRDASGASTSCPGDNLHAVLSKISAPIMAPTPPAPPTPPPPPAPPTPQEDPVLYFDTTTKTYLLVGGFGVIELTTAEGFVVDNDNANVTAVKVPHSVALKIKAAGA